MDMGTKLLGSSHLKDKRYRGCNK